jgi:hypothetical protein
MSSCFIYILLLIVQCKEQVPEVMRTRESIRACKIYTGKIFSNRRRIDKASAASKVRVVCYVIYILPFCIHRFQRNRSWILRVRQRVVEVWRKRPVQLRHRIRHFGRIVRTDCRIINSLRYYIHCTVSRRVIYLLHHRIC